VVESAESVAGSFDLFDDQVQAFGGSVGSTGGVMVQHFGAPPGEGVAEGLDLGYVVSVAAEDGLVDEGGGVGWIVDQVDVADGFFCQSRSGHLVVGVTDPQTQQHPIRACQEFCVRVWLGHLFRRFGIARGSRWPTGLGRWSILVFRCRRLLLSRL